ncbi:MAG TPA: NAD(P)H-hydrate dehydratase [Candidatus Acidoferrales bacterium]|nr:NAD(P)H-hydrate dehydratase [Candidatus Acidoferrales bacterium]
MQGLKGFTQSGKAGADDIRRATEPRKMSSNKYSNGSILIVGGGREYHGAPLMAAFGANNTIAALRTASGNVTVAVPKGVAGAVRALSANMIVRELSANSISKGDVKAINSIRHDVIVIGPGIDADKASLLATASIITSELKAGKRIVIDATAIKALSMKAKLTKNVVITPHTGEFKSLTGIDLKSAGIDERIKASVSVAKKLNCVVVLKGHETVITDGKSFKVNVAKSSALATIGTGDVLAGIIASYLAVHKDAFESAVAGVRVHSMVGDLLAKRMGNHIIAMDVAEHIPDVLKGFDVVV